MSFFGDLLAGGVGGLGAGIMKAGELDAQERLRKEQQDAALERYMLMDARSRDNALLRSDTSLALGEMRAAGKGSGSGSGGKAGAAGGTSIQQMMQDARASGDDAQVQNVIDYIRTIGGDDAAGRAADLYFKKPITQTVDGNLTPNDDEGNPMPAAPVQRNVQYNKTKGLTELNRLINFAANNGNTTKEYAGGEAGLTRNDLAGAATKQYLQENPGDAEGAAQTFQELSYDKPPKAGADGEANAPKVRSSYINEKGERVIIFSDGTEKVSGKTLDFETKLAGIIQRKAKDDPKFAKLKVEDQRAQALAILNVQPGQGAAPTAPAATSNYSPSAAAAAFKAKAGIK